jgi:hypothetical protein
VRSVTITYGFRVWRISRLGAVLRHATPRASRILSIFAVGKWTFVFPRRPHAPLTGRNTAGLARTKLLCSSGVSLIVPTLHQDNRASRRSCRPRENPDGSCGADSTASGKLRAISRKSLAVISPAYTSGLLGDYFVRPLHQ